MTTEPYKRPPIIEAVIGINFKAPVPNEVLADAKDRSKNDYPQVNTLENFQIEVQLQGARGSSNNTALNKTGQRGFKLNSPDVTEILILQPTVVTVAQLPPYPGWEPFFKRFQRDWRAWKRAAGYREISRIGVRYINRIDIPLGADDGVLEEGHYLNIFPNVPPSLSPVDGYAVQTRSRLPAINGIVTINSGIVTSPILGHMSILLDQDVACDQDPPQNDEALFDLLARIRDEKNKVFEACLNQGAREIFNSP